MKRGGLRRTWRMVPELFARVGNLTGYKSRVRPQIAFAEADPRAGRLVILTKADDGRTCGASE
jgi:hypothetical protein